MAQNRRVKFSRMRFERYSTNSTQNQKYKTFFHSRKETLLSEKNAITKKQTGDSCHQMLEELDLFDAEQVTIYPTSRAFLSGKSFSMYEVVRVSSISRSPLI